MFTKQWRHTARQAFTKGLRSAGSFLKKTHEYGTVAANVASAIPGLQPYAALAQGALKTADQLGDVANRTADKLDKAQSFRAGGWAVGRAVQDASRAVGDNLL